MINNHMINFLIQSKDNVPYHDFSYELIEAINYHEWIHSRNDSNYAVYFSDDSRKYKNVYPVGTVEFVLDSLEYQYGIKGVKPLNIPEKFMTYEYLQRNMSIFYSKGSTLIDGEHFYKDYNIIKGITDFLGHRDYLPKGKYLKSNIIEIDSEWRIFVNQSPIHKKNGNKHNEIVGCHYYAGDHMIFPSSDFVKNFVKKFDYQYPYVLDVGVNDKGTFIIELQDFFSCGLYGFRDYKILPSMFVRTINMLKRKYSTCS